MPQLYPMNWNFLNFFFLIMMIISITQIYFIFSIKKEKNQTHMKFFNKIWKW
uniref:ATP synthase F0 subunit 8 n=1 Tax=Alectorobius rudis TaxID=2058922 RepID=UPI0022375FCC|nr:ATP synthase F0 subunit 8 [Alectorobius rudis]UYB78616.1 ATP synthase F0 subunit 8 [Alectorobius rudis]